MGDATGSELGPTVRLARHVFAVVGLLVACAGRSQQTLDSAAAGMSGGSGGSAADTGGSDAGGASGRGGISGDGAGSDGGLAGESGGVGGTSAGSSGQAGSALQCPSGAADCNLAPGDGCETPLDTSSNCGACGRVCLGVTCNARNVCDTVPVGSLFRGGLVASPIVAGGSVFQLVDGGTVRWVFRTTVDGGQAVVLDQTGLFLHLLAADADYFYAWTGSEIVREGLHAPAGTTPETVFSPVSVVDQLRLQGNAMYFPEADGKIYKRGLASPGTDSGSVVVDGNTSDAIRLFAVTPTHMYWTFFNSVTQQPSATDKLRMSNIDGSQVADVVGALPARGVNIAVKDEDVLFIQSAGVETDGVYRCSFGGKPQLLFAKANLTDLAVDGNFVYLVESGKNVLSVPVAGGDALPIAELVQPNSSGKSIAYWNVISGFDAKRGFAVASTMTVDYTIRTFGTAVIDGSYVNQIFAFVK